jgi:type IV pilus biogenesis protein CpaD/CtpE
MRTPALFLLAIIGLALTGCEGALDPFQRPGNWAMTGAARQNLAVQTATPADLLSGQSSATSNGVAASAGIDKALGASDNAAGLQTAPPALNATLGSGS